MAQEEHGMSYGAAAAIGGSVSKAKIGKQKKVPQRGLGVAQLEKIRLDEERKNEASQAGNVVVGSVPNDEIRAPCLCPNFGPPCPNSSPNFPSPNALYLSSSQAYPFQGGGGDLGFQGVLIHGNQNWHTLYPHVKEERAECVGFELARPVEGLHPLQPCSSLSSSSCSLVVNPSSGISASSPALSSQIEPPSNQILCSSNYPPPQSWTEGDQVVGIKRPYPFSIESPLVPSLAGNVHLAKTRLDELELPPCSSSTGVAAQTEPRYKCVRDSNLNINSLPKQKLSYAITDDKVLNGDFLTLAPPVAASPPFNPEDKNASDYSDSEVLHITHETVESQIHPIGQGSTSTAKEPFSFFPVGSQNNQNLRGEKLETIDLSLKL